MARRPAPETLVAAVASGDYRRSLAALRDRLAAELSAGEGHGTAALAKELASVLRTIDGLPPVKEASALDDLRARRVARSG